MQVIRFSTTNNEYREIRIARDYWRFKKKEPSWHIQIRKVRIDGSPLTLWSPLFRLIDIYYKYEVECYAVAKEFVLSLVDDNIILKENIIW